MIQVCIVCNRIYGEKEPLTLREYTHGLCLECLEAKLKVEEGGELNVAGGSSRETVLLER